MAYRSSFGGGGGQLVPHPQQPGAAGQTQQPQQMDQAAATKPLIDASEQSAAHNSAAGAVLIERELSYDERSDNALDNLSTADNGLYKFDSRRLQLRRTVPIPQAILDQYDQLECKSFVGLFPEISRAFVTIDNRLFLWNYHDGSDFMLYDELSQIIVSVALMRPRAGVFVAAVEWVLVVATPVEVLLFALLFEGGSMHGSLQLVPTEFTIPSDNVHMTNIVGTEQGRILLAGKDGGMYELEYWGGSQQSGTVGGWLGGAGNLWSATSRRKCRKVSHSAPRFKLLRSLLPGFLGGVSADAPAAAGAASQQLVSCMVYDRTRNLVYTLSSAAGAATGSSNPVLSCFSLGADGWSLTPHSRCDRLGAEVRAALRALPVNMWEDLAPQQSSSSSGRAVTPELGLVSLFVIPRHESRVVLLMALTAHGHRIFFDMGEEGRSPLRVRFVRLSPPAVSPEELNRGGGAVGAGVGAGGRVSSHKLDPSFSKSASPSLVHAAYYKDGILLMADAGRSALGDTLVAVQREVYASDPGSSSLRAWGGAPGGGVLATKLLESLDAFDLDSRIAELGEVHESAQLNLLSSSLYSRTAIQAATDSVYGRSPSSAASSASLRPLQGLSELAVQHVTPPRHFLILTSSALMTLVCQRPLDELKAALGVLRRTSDEAPLVQLWEKYGAKELGAMCLTLIGAHVIGGEAAEQRLANGAGGVGALLSLASPDKSLGSEGRVSEDAMRKLAKQAFFRVADLQAQVAQAQMPALMYSGVAAGRVPGAPVPPSSRLEAVALYLSRWMRSHWDWSLCVPTAGAPASPSSAAALGSSLITLRFGQEYYLQLLQPLIKLQRFLQENQRLLMREVAAPGVQQQQQQQQQQLAQQALAGSVAAPGQSHSESDTIHSLSTLLGLSIELLHLCVLFLSHAGSVASGLGVSVNGSGADAAASALLHSSPFLGPVDLQRLRDNKFSDVLTSAEGHALIRKLISTLAQGGAAAAAAVSSSGSRALLGGPLAGLSPARGKRARERGDDRLAEFGSPMASANGFGSSSASSSTLISQLHASCPTFFGPSDLLYYKALESLTRARASWHIEAEREAHLSRALDTFSSFLHAPAFPLEEVALKLKQVHAYEGIVGLALQRAELLERREVVRPLGLFPSASQAFGGAAQAAAAVANGSEQDFYSAEKRRCVVVLLDTLSVLLLGVGAGGKLLNNSESGSAGASGPASPRRDSVDGSSSLSLSPSSSSSPSPPSVPGLSPESLARVRERVLAQLLASPDESIHFALYGWLIEKGLLAQMYAVKNECVVKFLMSREECVLLLKDYYIRHERWWEAAKLLNFLALTRNDTYTLTQRCEFITRSRLCALNYQQQLALQAPAPSLSRGSRRRGSHGGLSSSSSGGAVSSSLGGASASEVHDFIQQAQDRIKIAEMQMEVFQQMHSHLQEELSTFPTRKSAVSSALSQLDHELLDLQSLYLLCTNHGLWEQCLAIFAFSDKRERSDVISALWKNILRAQMAPALRTKTDWGEQVAAKVAELAALYQDQEFLFPLPFLIRELETYNVLHRLSPSPTFVSDTLLGAGLPPSRLLPAYESVLESAEHSVGEDEHGFDVHRANAQGQTVQTFLFYSIHNVMERMLAQESSSSRRSPAFASGSGGAASAAHLLNECVTSLRTLPPSADTSQLARLFQTLDQRFAQRRP